MAFDARNVIYGRGRHNNFATPTGLVTHTYFSETDTLGQIAAASYFSDYLDATSEDVIVGDLIQARDMSGNFNSYRIDTVSPVAITAVAVDGNPFDQSLNTTDSPTFSALTLDGTGLKLPTAGGTPSSLDYYEVLAPIVFTWTGAFTSNESATVTAERLGNVVTLTFESLTAAQDTTDLVVSTAPVLPANFRPSSPIELAPCAVTDDGGRTGAVLTIIADGLMSMSRIINPPFTGLNNLTFPRFSATYSIL